jgi:hypothetical protein
MKFRPRPVPPAVAGLNVLPQYELSFDNLHRPNVDDLASGRFYQVAFG